MTVTKGFVIVIISALAFAVAGALIGFTLGTTMPGYYRAVFSSGRQPWFDPVAVGVGQGLTQGLVCGVVVGAVVVLAVAWSNSRRRPPEIKFLPPDLAAPAERPAESHGITARPNG